MRRLGLRTCLLGSLVLALVCGLVRDARTLRRSAVTRRLTYMSAGQVFRSAAPLYAMPGVDCLALFNNNTGDLISLNLG